jgi:hypothetical protein
MTAVKLPVEGRAPRRAFRLAWPKLAGSGGIVISGPHLRIQVCGQCAQQSQLPVPSSCTLRPGPGPAGLLLLVLACSAEAVLEHPSPEPCFCFGSVRASPGRSAMSAASVDLGGTFQLPGRATGSDSSGAAAPRGFWPVLNPLHSPLRLMVAECQSPTRRVSEPSTLAGVGLRPESLSERRDNVSTHTRNCATNLSLSTARRSRSLSLFA